MGFPTPPPPLQLILTSPDPAAAILDPTGVTPFPILVYGMWISFSAGNGPSVAGGYSVQWEFSDGHTFSTSVPTGSDFVIVDLPRTRIPEGTQYNVELVGPLHGASGSVVTGLVYEA